MHSSQVLILEDNQERVERFKSVLKNIDKSLEIKFWKSARKMIKDVDLHLPSSILISLDHDLEPLVNESSDPGDGLDVAKFLTTHSPVCPVIIHSSNIDRSNVMAGELELGGWPIRRVAPIGPDWIEQDWRLAVRQLISNTC